MHSNTVYDRQLREVAYVSTDRGVDEADVGQALRGGLLSQQRGGRDAICSSRAGLETITPSEVSQTCVT